MNTDRKILRLGAAVIVCATLIRLASGTLPEKLGQLVSEKTVMSWLVFLQTGRVVRTDTATQTPEPVPTLPSEAPAQEVAAPLTQQPLILRQEDVDAVQVQNGTGQDVDLEQLLARPLNWDLRTQEPSVLILHTHATESYTKTEEYEESSDYRTLDADYNMISVGAELAACLEAEGIRVIHDRTAYDYPSYSGSYNQARGAIEDYLARYPSICLVLDIHRDAMEGSDGSQLGYTAQTQAGTAAKLMLVCGSDAGGLDYPNWQENLSVAVKLQAVLERQCPGLCRPVSLRTGRYNQDLFANMILIEVGAAGNTRQQALLAVQELARGIAQMADGVTVQG